MGLSASACPPPPPPENPKLNVKKVVVGDSTAPSAFRFAVSNGGGTHAFEADGTNTLTLPAGTYTVTEPAVSGWTTTYCGCSEIVLASSQTTVPTCTITNTKQQSAPPAASAGEPEAEREEGRGRRLDRTERVLLRGLQRRRNARLRGRRHEHADPARRDVHRHRAGRQRLDDDLLRLLEDRARLVADDRADVHDHEHEAAERAACRLRRRTRS